MYNKRHKRTHNLPQTRIPGTINTRRCHSQQSCVEHLENVVMKEKYVFLDSPDYIQTTLNRGVTLNKRINHDSKLFG